MTSRAIWSWDKTGNIPRKICSAQICIQMLRLLAQHVSLNEVARYSEIAPNSGPLGADHLILEGGCGWFRKNISCKPLSEEKNCMQHKWNRKKILALLQARKKNVAKLFHHSRGTLQNPSKTATILPLLPLNSGVGYASECAMHS